MARKRNYKAEYARAKAKAKAAGYKSEREYKAVRKALGLKRGISPVPRRVLEREAPGQTKRAVQQANRVSRTRAKARAWARAHSRSSRSAYSPKFSDDQADAYYRVYVDDIESDERRRIMIGDYLLDFELIDVEEWKQEYGDE